MNMKRPLLLFVLLSGLLSQTGCAGSEQLSGLDDQENSSIELALSKLDIGYIDIMLLHHPGTNDVKAYKAMEKYQAAGKRQACPGAE